MKSRNRTSGGNPAGQAVWIFSAFVLGYVTAGFYDLASLSRLVEKLQAKPVAREHVQSMQGHRPSAPHEPEYEFYTLLTKDKQGNIHRVPPKAQAVARPMPTFEEHRASQVSSRVLESRAPHQQIPLPGSTAPAVNTAPPVAQKAPPVHTAVPVYAAPKQAPVSRYTIQIAAFRQRSDAEQMKARLLLNGYDAYITAFNQAGKLWFRVVIGPYTNRVAVDRARAALAQRHIQGIIRQEQG